MYSTVSAKMRKIADPEKHCIYLLTFPMFRKRLKQPPTKR